MCVSFAVKYIFAKFMWNRQYFLEKMTVLATVIISTILTLIALSIQFVLHNSSDALISFV